MYQKLCIPCVSSAISLSYVGNIINQANFGTIISIHESPSFTREHSKKIFITMDINKKDVSNDKILFAIKEGKPLKIVYDEPNFWKAVPCC